MSEPFVAWLVHSRQMPLNCKARHFKPLLPLADALQMFVGVPPLRIAICCNPSDHQPKRCLATNHKTAWSDPMRSCTFITSFMALVTISSNLDCCTSGDDSEQIRARHAFAFSEDAAARRALAGFPTGATAHASLGWAVLFFVDAINAFSAALGYYLPQPYFLHGHHSPYGPLWMRVSPPHR